MHKLVVDLRLPMTQMDVQGKKAASDTISELTTGGATNLSGGLLKGIDVLSGASGGGGANANKAVLLFTDGQANNGITDPAGIVAAAQGAMVGSPMTVFTFGFGGDHQESLLRSLSEIRPVDRSCCMAFRMLKLTAYASAVEP